MGFWLCVWSLEGSSELPGGAVDKAARRKDKDQKPVGINQQKCTTHHFGSSLPAGVNWERHKFPHAACLSSARDMGFKRKRMHLAE